MAGTVMTHPNSDSFSLVSDWSWHSCVAIVLKYLSACAKIVLMGRSRRLAARTDVCLVRFYIQDSEAQDMHADTQSQILTLSVCKCILNLSK